MSGRDRPRFGVEYIQHEFEKIDGRLKESLQAYLLGGGAMSIRDLKETTKDIDLLVDSSDAHGQLLAVLTDLGYEKITDPGPEYEELGAKSCVKNAEGCQFDIFDRQVVNKLVLTNGMEGRAEEVFTGTQLSVSMVSIEDIFLFKAVAMRPDDIGDMAVLVQTGLDFGVIESELRVQVEHHGHRLFATYVGGSLEKLESQAGITLPLAETVDEISRPHFQALEIHFNLEGATSIAELAAQHGHNREAIEDLVSQLVQLGKVERDGDEVRPLD